MSGCGRRGTKPTLQRPLPDDALMIVARNATPIRMALNTPNYTAVAGLPVSTITHIDGASATSFDGWC